VFAHSADTARGLQRREEFQTPQFPYSALARPQAYQTTSGKPQEQPLSNILLHLFNQQTHHRGQAHACLSILTKQEPPALDLLLLQRGLPPPNLAERLGSSTPA